MERSGANRTAFAVYLLLMLLLAGTVAVAYVDFGVYSDVLAFVIALLKAGLVMVYFMHLRTSGKLVWIYAGAGAVWLTFATILTFADYLTREMVPLASGR